MSDSLDERRRQEFDDQQNALAGREVGRVARSGVGTSRSKEVKEKERKDRAFRNALEQLLQDPEYRRLYKERGNRLSDAEIEADAAIAALQDQISGLEDDIAAMEDAAARDPSGRLVFQHSDGRVVYADGSEVSPEIAEGIIWPDGAPSADDYFAAKDRLTALDEDLKDWVIYRNDVLGGIRDRYDDPNNPFEGKDAVRRELDRIQAERPAPISQPEMSSPSREATDVVPKAFPNIGA